MSMIRDKKLKKFHSDSRNTIDQIHNDIIIQNTESISVCYEKYKQEDGFMYVIYSSENTFGGCNTD